MTRIFLLPAWFRLQSSHAPAFPIANSSRTSLNEDAITAVSKLISQNDTMHNIICVNRIIHDVSVCVWRHNNKYHFDWIEHIVKKKQFHREVLIRNADTECEAYKPLRNSTDNTVRVNIRQNNASVGIQIIATKLRSGKIWFNTLGIDPHACSSQGTLKTLCANNGKKETY